MSDDSMKAAIRTVLRRRRAQLDPGQFGIKHPPTRGRRADGLGLTQEDVDAILQMGRGTYQRVEAGRYAKPPEALLRQIADLLDLTEHEWTWLWRMTWRRNPPHPLHLQQEEIPGAWRRVMDRNDPGHHMSYLTNYRWDLRWHDPAFPAMFPRREVPRNTTRWTLLHPDARHILVDWELSWATQVVPHLWAARAQYPQDPVLAEMERAVLDDKRCGPIYREFGPIFVHADGAVRPMHHAELGPGWVTMLVAGPKSASTAQVTHLIFDAGDEPPQQLPPIQAMPTAA